MSFNKWQDFLEESRKRGSGPGLEKSLKWFLDHGPQKKGGYPKKRRPNFKKKKFNDISAPPGAAGGLEEEVEESSFEMQPNLQPEFWHDNKIWPQVQKRLLAIVEDFIEGLEIEVSIEDIRLTGSLANYNWSKYSDVDVHIIVDFAEIDEDTQLVKSFFDAARARWNILHAIDIYGFQVELYVENTSDVHHSSGLYSLLDTEWITEPSRRDVEIDFVTARKKSDDIETRINLIGRMIDAGKLKSGLKSIERIKHKIRRMRQAGLNSPQKEFSPENIAFKILRRNDTLARLADMKYNAYDTKMSISEEASEISND
jgi:predicted nucleotidyltransferase